MIWLRVAESVLRSILETTLAGMSSMMSTASSRYRSAITARSSVSVRSLMSCSWMSLSSR